SSGKEGTISSGKLAAAILPLVLSGCQPHPHSPMVPVFGSFVPAWTICAIVGIVFAVLLRQILVGCGIDQYLPLKLPVYLGASILAGVGFWLFLYAGLPR